MIQSSGEDDIDDPLAFFVDIFSYKSFRLYVSSSYWLQVVRSATFLNILYFS